ncbi:ribonuclease H-like domain-containing protein [Tanacetum coccineum]
MTDYSLWEVIKNGNKVLKRTVRETEQEYEPTTAEEKQDRRNEMKARGTLRYGGNKESKKVQRTLLKQQYENFAGSNSETMDKTFDRLQKLITQMEIQGDEIETISLDDLYNNLKIYEPEISGSSNNSAYGVSAAHTQSNPTSGDNLSDVVICSFLASQPNSPQLAQEDLEQIDPDDLEEMDLHWEMAMLTIRGGRFIKRTCRKLDVNGQRVGFDRTKVECYNYHKYGHFERECKAHRNQENRGREINRRTVTLETPIENALVAQDGIGGYDWSYQAEEEHPINFALMAHTSSGSSSSSDSEESQIVNKFKSGLGYNTASSTVASPAVESFVNTSKMLENQEHNKSKYDKGYHAVPPPFTGNFIPRKLDLTFMDEIVESENIDVTTIVTPSNVKTVESNHESAGVKRKGDAVEPTTFKKNSFRLPFIKDWNSDDENEVEIIPKDKTISSSTKKIKLVKTARETVEKVIRPVWNNSSRVNHKKFANKITHPHPNRRFDPQAVLTKSVKINTASASVNTAVRPVNIVGSKPTMNHPRSISNAYKRGYSQVTRPFNKYSEYKNNIFNKKLNTVRVKDTTTRDRAVVSENKGKGVNAIKASACWGNPQQKEYKEKGVIDSGCSRHMTRNKCYLTEYADYDGGFVSFGDGKGRISGKV